MCSTIARDVKYSILMTMNVRIGKHTLQTAPLESSCK